MTKLPIAVQEEEIANFCHRWKRPAIERGENYIRRKSILSNLKVIYAAKEPR